MLELQGSRVLFQSSSFTDMEAKCWGGTHSVSWLPKAVFNTHHPPPTTAILQRFGSPKKHPPVWNRQTVLYLALK